VIGPASPVGKLQIDPLDLQQFAGMPFLAPMDDGQLFLFIH
jgi:hypothetical protein